MARPATPPTIPPTRSCVGGAPLPPAPPFELDEGEGVGAVLPELPLPPAPAALALDITDANDAWLESCDDAGADPDVASVAGVNVVCSELVPEAWVWRDALGFVASEMKVIIVEMLANEDCDTVGSAEREGDKVPDSELSLLGFEDVVVEADIVPL